MRGTLKHPNTMTTPDVNQIVPGSNGTVPLDQTTPPAAPGSKTDPTLLLQSLQEEREKRRIAEEDKAKAEAKLLELQNSFASGESLSEEGKVLKAQIATLEGVIADTNAKMAQRDLEAKFPVLKDKAAEFEAYRADPKNAGMSLETAAKAFLVDNNLLETPPTRKGIERPSGGGRNATPQGWTLASIEELRNSNFRKYSQLLKEGAFKDVTA